LKLIILDKSLLELYESGKSRKYRLPENVLRKFFMRLQQIEAAKTIYDLWKTPSLRFEHLEGTHSYSMRITEKWRLEIRIEWDDEEKTTGTVTVTNISNHYGD